MEILIGLGVCIVVIFVLAALTKNIGAPTNTRAQMPKPEKQPAKRKTPAKNNPKPYAIINNSGTKRELTSNEFTALLKPLRQELAPLKRQTTALQKMIDKAYETDVVPDRLLADAEAYDSACETFSKKFSRIQKAIWMQTDAGEERLATFEEEVHFVTCDLEAVSEVKSLLEDLAEAKADEEE